MGNLSCMVFKIFFVLIDFLFENIFLFDYGRKEGGDGVSTQLVKILALEVESSWTSFIQVERI